MQPTEGGREDFSLFNVQLKTERTVKELLYNTEYCTMVLWCESIDDGYMETFCIIFAVFLKYKIISKLKFFKFHSEALQSTTKIKINFSL